MTVHFNRSISNLATASSPFGVVTVPARGGLYRNCFKQVFDVAVILLFTPIVLPVVAILALIVARDGHSPFYWSCRVGKGGRNFRMLKLRTMVPDAEGMLDTHLERDADASQEWQKTQKLKNDPRITAVGHFLRKTSFDELPQLWNVVTGDMSLVGPRPMLPQQRALYPGLAYFALRPGITGPWQVSDRNNCEFSRRADHDREYEQRLSLTSDLKLLFKTVSVVMRGTGY